MAQEIGYRSAGCASQLAGDVSLRACLSACLSAHMVLARLPLDQSNDPCASVLGIQKSLMISQPSNIPRGCKGCLQTLPLVAGGSRRAKLFSSEDHEPREIALWAETAMNSMATQ